MGNCVSQAGQREFLKNFQNVANGEGGGGFTSDDPEAFQVFVKKRNKFIPGYSKFQRQKFNFSKSDFQFSNDQWSRSLL